jgi:Aminoacyl-tRNA editing domain
VRVCRSGKADLLEAVLGVAPGGVTPFALINDRARRVQPLLDRAMLEYAQLNYHPLTNAAADLTRLLEACGHRPPDSRSRRHRRDRRLNDGASRPAGNRRARPGLRSPPGHISRLDSPPLCHAPFRRGAEP